MPAAWGGAVACQGPHLPVRALGFTGEGPRCLSRVLQGGCGGVGVVAEGALSGVLRAALYRVRPLATLAAGAPCRAKEDTTRGKKDTRNLDSANLYAQRVFSQVPKDWDVSLGVVKDRFFLFFQKNMD